MKIRVLLGLFVLSLGTPALADEIWSCPDGEFARKAYISGEIKTWPYYTDGPGARVQRQFPDTALTAHAKFIVAKKNVWCNMSILQSYRFHRNFLCGWSKKR